MRPLQARLVASEKQVKNLEWEVEVLQQRFGKVQVRRPGARGGVGAPSHT